MRLFRAAVEVRVPDSQEVVAALLEDTLAGYQVFVTLLDGGRISAEIELVAATVTQAAQTAVGVVRQVTGAEPDACHVVPEADLSHRRQRTRIVADPAATADLSA